MTALAGKHIVVTRAMHQAEELSSLLREHGAQPLLYPCISIVPPADTTLLDAALLTIDEYDWLVVTSSNTAYMLAQRCDALDLEPGTWAVRVAAVGTATAEAVRQYLGLVTDVVPDEHLGDALAAELAARLPAGSRVLLPQSEIARPILYDTLTAAGIHVTAPTAYRTVQGEGGVDLPLLIMQGTVDAVTFTSTSTVTYFLSRYSYNGGDFDLLSELVFACIGPVTAQAAQENGLRNVITADDYTLHGLITVLNTYFSI